MRSRSSITIEPITRPRSRSVARLAVLFCVLFFSGSGTLGQRVAVITPDMSERTTAYSDRTAAQLSSSVRIQDTSLTDAAFRAVPITDPFNMSVAEARAVAAAVGCDYFLLIRSGASRRSSCARPEYYEAFAVLCLVSGRTGNMLLWRLKSFDADHQLKADQALGLSIDGTADGTAPELINKMKTASGAEIATVKSGEIEDVPIEGTAAAIDFKPPIPYRRIKPNYKVTAFLYDIRATVEIEANIGSDGSVLSTRPVGWAGFGLEDSAVNAVRSMYWRPAMRNGKPLPMRVLLRYNFTKVDKE